MRSGGQQGFFRVLLLLVLMAAGGAGVVAYEGHRRLSAPGLHGDERIVWVQRGDSLGRLANKLSDRGIISEKNEKLFYYYGRATGLAADLRAGEFVVPAGASIREVATVLKDADPLLRFVTVPEGRTVAQALAIVGEAPLLLGDVSVTPSEGDLLPETYAYERGETRDAVVERMMAAHFALLDELWPQRAEGLPFDTPEEAIILASIVEKETAVPAERPRVAAVFVNRLKKRMRLQSDPTIIYGITGGEPLGRGIRRSELDNQDNPYNTYKINGLPPTAIANPGRESIAAVLNPAPTDDLYFVADGTGGHAFASSLEEHNRNVARWRKIERAAKQK
ncbi:MAG: endolytic transglycosylase MltG [Parvularculaceae bacterium]|nr:endolytic transglycosylase MltG [Parvularculaceae bacterium]